MLVKAVVNRFQSVELQVQVGAAAIVDLGQVNPPATSRLEFHVVAAGGHLLSGGTFTLAGTSFTKRIGGEGEVELSVPPGCYDARAAVPGLGELTLSFCATAGMSVERTITFGLPDGSAGREGCSVTGCRLGLVCGGDRSCH